MTLHPFLKQFETCSKYFKRKILNVKLECFDPVEIGHPGSINSGETLLAPSDPLLSILDLLNIKFYSDVLSEQSGVMNW